MEVVLASSGDTNELASVLATAYRDNPLFRWMFAEELDLDLLRTIFVSLVEGALPQQCVYKTSQNTGAAIWALPRTDTPPPNLRQSGQDLTTSSGRRAEALQILGAHRPAEPHLYLAAVGDCTSCCSARGTRRSAYRYLSREFRPREHVVL
jgi:hypothetical protein